MDTYRYTAKTLQGEETAGILEASSFEEALQMLADCNLSEIQVFAIQRDSTDQPQAPVALSSQEAGELSRHVAQVSTAQVPLAAGLRAAADETAYSCVATALIWIASQIEQGRTLEETLTESGQLLPPHITGLILAAARTGSLGEALFEIVELQQTTYALRREIASGYEYPLTVLILATGIIVGSGYYLTGIMGKMISEFGLTVPMLTRVLFWWRDTGVWLVGSFVVLMIAVAILYRTLGGAIRWRRLLSTMPLFGALWHWTGVAEWAGLLSVLLRHQVPLPEALRWAGRGVADAHVGHLSLRLADGVARGRLLSQMMHITRQMPASIIPLIEWGEKSGTLSDSFRVGQAMLEKRTKMRALLLQSVIPPLLFLGVGSAVLFLVAANFAPMINLISALS